MEYKVHSSLARCPSDYIIIEVKLGESFVCASMWRKQPFTYLWHLLMLQGRMPRDM
jgi:hypothetical protein